MDANLEPTEADVNAEYPHWRTWAGADGMRYARRVEGAALSACGEDWLDLMDEIKRAESFLATQEYSGRSEAIRTPRLGGTA